MKQRRIFNLVALFFVMFTISVVLSCKDEEEDGEWIISYPTTENYTPFEIQGAVGIFYYSGDTKKWYINFDDNAAVFHKGFGDEGGPQIEIANPSDNLKNYTGKVIVDGTMQFQYLSQPKDNRAFLSTHHYLFTLSNIETLNNTARTRADISEHLGCGTPNAPLPAWYFARTGSTTLAFEEYTIRVYTHIVKCGSRILFGHSASLCWYLF